MNSRDYAVRRKQTAQGTDAAPGVHKALAAPAKKAKGKEIAVHETKSKIRRSSGGSEIRRGGEVKPDEVIPMASGPASLRGVGSCVYEPEASP